MNPFDYCREKVAVPGSSYYYATVFLRPEQQRPYDTLFALWEELQAIPKRCSDPGIARSKLQWWRDELARALQAHEPRHPIGLALAAQFGSNLAVDDLLQLTDAVEHELGHGDYPSFAALLQHAKNGGGQVWRLVEKTVVPANSPNTAGLLSEVGARLELCDRLQDLREEMRIGRLPLPTDELRQHGINPADLCRHLESTAFRELLAANLRRLGTDLQALLASLPARDGIAALPAQILATLRLRLIDEILTDGCRLLTHRIALTPLRKFWIAWRTRRRVLRQSAGT